MKFFVTGATGFIGLRLASELQNCGFDVVALGRKAQIGPWVRFVEQDYNKSVDVQCDLLKDIDCVIHLAGIAHAESGVYKWADYYKINTESTTNLVEAAGKSGVKKFVFVSSIKACADPGEQCVDESWNKEPVDDYGRSKLLAEQAVIEISGKYDMDYVIVRPALVYGTNIKGNLLKMISAIDSGKFPSVPSVTNKRSLVHVADLCKALVLVANSEKAFSNTYIVSDQQYYSTRDIYEIMLGALEKPAKNFQIPKLCFNILAKIGDVIESTSNKKMPLNSVSLKKLFGSACYKSDKITKHLGFKAEYTLYSAMPEIVKSFKKSQKINQF
jgi:UDP-glucose 4-epimerase